MSVYEDCVSNDIGIILACKDDTNINHEDIERMMSAMRSCVSKYGYNILAFGSWDKFEKMIVDQKNILMNSHSNSRERK